MCPEKVKSLKPYYSRNGITIYHDDCRNILPHLEPVDLVLTDPPYSSGGQFRADRCRGLVNSKYLNSSSSRKYPEFVGDSMDQRSFTFFMSELFRHIRDVLKPGCLFSTFSDWRQLPSMTDAIQAAGLIWRGVAVWDKTPSCRPVLGRPRNQAEFIIWGTNGAHKPKGPVIPGVFSKRIIPAEKYHPTGKPVSVFDWFLGIANSNVVVLDPFMGSGSSLVAANNRGMHAVGIEKVEEYCEIAARRLEQYYGS